MDIDVNTLENTSDITLSNTLIDKVTLELLMNKSHYNRYIANTNPEKHAEMVKHNHLVTKYKFKIIELTNNLLSDPTKQITTDVNDAFTGYIKTLLMYFQMKDLEHASPNRSGDEDILFGDVDDAETEYDTNEQVNIDPLMKSFLGGNQVLKQKGKPDQLF